MKKYLKRLMTVIAILLFTVTVGFSGDQKSKKNGNDLLAEIFAKSEETPLEMYPPGFLDSLANGEFEARSASAEKVTGSSQEVLVPQVMNNVESEGNVSSPPHYQLIDLGTLPGGSTSWANDINNRGVVVGHSLDSNNHQQAVIYRDGIIKVIASDDTIPDGWSEAYDINDSNEIVGIYKDSAFLYKNDELQNLALISPGWRFAYGINNNGDIVGDAILYKNGVIYDLSGSDSNGNKLYPYKINDDGQIIGSIDNLYGGEGTGHPFLLKDGVVTDLRENDSECYFFSINNLGYMAGYGVTNTIAIATTYNNGITHYLGTPNGYKGSVAFGINNLNQVVGMSWVENSGSSDAFLYENGTMYILNNIIEPTSHGWDLESATSINDEGQIVGYGWNPQGQLHAFLLNPIPSGYQEAIEAQPLPPTYGDIPLREAGKSNLVFITHGAIPWWENAQESVAWVNSLSNSVAQYLNAHNMTNWQVAGHEWIEGAKFPFLGTPQSSLKHAQQEGAILGKVMATNGWAHVHLIGHSAGAGLIQAISEQIRDHATSGTTIHCTFLDPFVGLLKENAGTYGNSATWADQYYSRDLTTGGDIYKVTETPLTNAYNADVTWLFKQRTAGVFVSGGIQYPCERTISSHAAAISFYSNTITGSVSSEYEGVGFPLSLEGGNWSLRGQFEAGALNILGTPDPICTSFTLGNTPGGESSVNVAGSSSYVSGDIQQYSNGFTAVTHSPSWLSMVISLTNRANYVSFDARFESDPGAAGLLTAYWNTNVIGSVDEKTTDSGWTRYTFSIPLAETTSAHVLGFRLDPFTNIQSTVTVTNIVLGLVGPSEPFNLAVVTNAPGNQLVMRLTGEAGFMYAVEASTNLLNWQPIALLANTNGAVQFYDGDSTNYAYRFYRAVTTY